METFQTRLAALMQEKGLNQKQLAKLIGVNPSTVHGYLTGTKKPGIKTQKKIADLYDSSIDYLMGYTDKRYASKNENEQVMIDSLDIVLNNFVNDPSSKEFIRLAYETKAKGYTVEDLIGIYEVVKPPELIKYTALVKRIKEKEIDPDRIKGFKLKDIDI